MKKILGICGTQKKGEFSSSRFLLEQALEAAKEEGVEIELINLVDYNILECRGCANCLANLPCPLHEDPKDEHNKLYQKCMEADGFIFSSPVYALSLPSIWKRWIDRCDVNTADDLDYDFYNYDTVESVKGKAFRGKVAGQIAVAAGLGHELALSSLSHAFIAVKLTVVANAGITLAEYDAEAGIKKEDWSKDIHEAQFAIDMARAIGKRVAETVGYTAFTLHDNVGKKALTQEEQLHFWKEGKVEDSEGNQICLEDFKEDLLVIIGCSQKTGASGVMWNEKISLEYINCSNIHTFSVASIGQLPHFITKDFVKSSVERLKQNTELYYDWDQSFARACNMLSEEQATILIVDKKKGQTLMFQAMEFNRENVEKVLNTINSYIA